MICILLTQTLCFCMDQCIPLALYSPDSTMWGKYLYIFWDHQAQPKLTEFATIYQSWPNSLQINQCFQVLLDVNSKHYPILSKVKAEILAAFAEYVWWRAMVTLAVCNSCRERLHWDMCCGENTVPFYCLGSTPYRVSPLPFSWLIGMSHRMSHPTSTKDMSFMVCVTWLSGEPGQAFFHFCLREVSIGWHHTIPCLWSSIIFWHWLSPSSGEVFVFIMGTYYINNTRCSTVAGELEPCSGVLLEVCQHKVVLRTLVLTLQFPWCNVG